MRSTLDTSNLDSGPAPVVLRHTMRQTWGRAVMVWEAPGKRAFQFEDGSLRIFKDGFYHLLEQVEMEEAEARRLAARLVRKADRDDAPEAATKAADQPAAPKVREANAVDARVAWFTNRYPGGFEGDKWLREQRSSDTSTRKRHRDIPINSARERLVAGADAVALATALGEIASATDLVSPKTGPQFLGLSDDGLQRLGEGLQQLLDREVAFPIRFERWLDRLMLVAPTLSSWAVATLPLALLEPEDHFFVRRTMTRREASLRGMIVPTAPSAPVYDQLLAMAVDLREQLVAAECPPADLIDVHDFIRITLSPAAQKELTRG